MIVRLASMETYDEGFVAEPQMGLGDVLPFHACPWFFPFGEETVDGGNSVVEVVHPGLAEVGRCDEGANESGVLEATSGVLVKTAVTSHEEAIKRYVPDRPKHRRTRRPDFTPLETSVAFGTHLLSVTRYVRL